MKSGSVMPSRCLSFSHVPSTVVEEHMREGNDVV